VVIERSFPVYCYLSRSYDKWQWNRLVLIHFAQHLYVLVSTVNDEYDIYKRMIVLFASPTNSSYLYIPMQSRSHANVVYRFNQCAFSWRTLLKVTMTYRWSTDISLLTFFSDTAHKNMLLPWMFIVHYVYFDLFSFEK
jgi:hypothetical protein